MEQVLEFRTIGRRLNPPETQLAGKYKGKRQRPGPPVVEECACGWRSRPMSPKKAEAAQAKHFRTCPRRKD